MKAKEALPSHDDTSGGETKVPSKGILTSKELKVLELISYGYANRDIATLFQTSGQAVKNMVRTINLKLGADNRTHAVAVCFRNGWLPAEEGSLDRLRAEDGIPKLSDSFERAAQFRRRWYEDGTIDSVCERCGLVIAQASRASDLDTANGKHVCQSRERRRAVRVISAAGWISTA